MLYVIDKGLKRCETTKTKTLNIYKIMGVDIK